MARPRSASYDVQREAILNAAVRAFSEIGYPSASMAQLARSCGVSKATLYHYFESKEALLFEALRRHTAELLTLVRAATEAAPPGPARWAAVVRALMPAYRRARVFHAALINDVKFLPAEERAIIVTQQRAVVDAIAAVLNEAFPDRIPPERLKPVTMALLGMLNFSFAWLRPDGPMSHEEFGELALSLSLHGLAGAPA
jgi:AcrR family transcriptional regulator